MLISDNAAKAADFGVYAQEILDPQSPTYSSKPNVVVLALQTRDIAPELWTRGTVASAEALAAARTRVVDEFRSYVTSFRSRSQVPELATVLESQWALAMDSPQVKLTPA